MKIQVLLTAFLAILLAGCDLRPKPKVVTPVTPKPVAAPAPTPAPPPSPLSVPQTNVVLPKEQPLDEAALVTQPAPPPEPAAPAAGPPQRQRNRPAAVSTPAVTPPPAATTPPATAEPREPVQEIVPPADFKRLQERAHASRGEAAQILDRVGKRRLTPTQQGVAASIRSFLALSEQAEGYNDMRQADALAERAQILAKELQSGK
ncbi:MAG: hypothetical protein ABI806_13755 [Candidatus Solibacter sp.]